MSTVIREIEKRKEVKWQLTIGLGNCRVSEKISLRWNLSQDMKDAYEAIDKVVENSRKTELEREGGIFQAEKTDREKSFCNEGKP